MRNDKKCAKIKSGNLQLMLSNYFLRTVMTSKMQIICFFLDLIKFLMNFNEILKNNRMNLFPTIFQKNFIS